MQNDFGIYKPKRLILILLLRYIKRQHWNIVSYIVSSSNSWHFVVRVLFVTCIKKHCDHDSLLQFLCYITGRQFRIWSHSWSFQINITKWLVFIIFFFFFRILCFVLVSMGRYRSSRTRASHYILRHPIKDEDKIKIDAQYQIE